MEKFKVCIENYINDEYSICREERQYALYLYNILYKCKFSDVWEKKCRGILDECGIPKEAKIINVFYEATFMRDFFERNRRLDYFMNKRSGDLENDLLRGKVKLRGNKLEGFKNSKEFNQKLIEYIVEEKCDNDTRIKESFDYRNIAVNLGHNKVNGDDRVRFIAKCMMNAKPDIAVIYEKKPGEKITLKFIECKFEEAEAKYIFKDNKESFLQTDIQKMIGEFIVKGSDKYVFDTAKIVTFTRNSMTDMKSDSGINISTLIKLNEELMGGTI